MGAASQLKKLYQQAIGGVAPSDAASSSGSMAAMLKYLIANPGGAKRVGGSGYQVLPSAAAGVNPVVGSTWANGAWSQITASTPAAIYLCGVEWGWQNAGAGTSCESEIDIGTGGAGSETRIATVVSSFLVSTNVGVTGSGRAILPFPIAIANATRVAARIRTANTGYIPQFIKILYVNQSDLAGL